MFRWLTAFFAALLLALPLPAAARVVLSFHSFNGSWLVGRFPHTFVALDGALDNGGAKIHQNFGYTAKKISPSILKGNVEAEIYVEKDYYLTATNTHFSVVLNDAQYRAVIAEVGKWRDEPGKAYNLDRHNCIHFVAAIAELVGIKAPVPQSMVRRPKEWLNYITGLNPQLGAKVLK